MAVTTQVSKPVALARLRWVLGQVLVVALGVFVYVRIRGITDASVDVAHAHAGEIVRLERWLGLDVEAAVQAPVASSETLATAANWVYVWGHWPVIAVTLLWLVLDHPAGYRVTRNAMLISGGVGLFVFALYPVAPPRLADLGLVDTVTTYSSAYRVLQPQAFVNQYAAMPSLHAGWDLLIGIALFTWSQHRAIRIVGVMLPALMAVSVVSTANHYVADVVAGITLVLLARAAAVQMERRRALRHGSHGRADASPPPSPDIPRPRSRPGLAAR